jgi:hypothetical protein
MDNTLALVVGLCFIVFHRIAAQGTVEFWRAMGRSYNETMWRVIFILSGVFFGGIWPITDVGLLQIAGDTLKN